MSPVPEFEHFTCEISPDDNWIREKICDHLPFQTSLVPAKDATFAVPGAQTIGLSAVRYDRDIAIAESWKAAGPIVFSETEDFVCRALLLLNHSGYYDYALVRLTTDRTEMEQRIAFAQGLVRVHHRYDRRRDTTSLRRKAINQLIRYVMK